MGCTSDCFIFLPYEGSRMRTLGPDTCRTAWSPWWAGPSSWSPLPTAARGTWTQTKLWKPQKKLFWKIKKRIFFHHNQKDIYKDDSKDGENLCIQKFTTKITNHGTNIYFIDDISDKDAQVRCNLRHLIWLDREQSQFKKTYFPSCVRNILWPMKTRGQIMPPSPPKEWVKKRRLK